MMEAPTNHLLLSHFTGLGFLHASGGNLRPLDSKRWGRKPNKIGINAFPLQECNSLPRHLPGTWLGWLRQLSTPPPHVNKSAYGLDWGKATIKLKLEANAGELTGLLTNCPEQEIYWKNTKSKIKLPKKCAQSSRAAATKTLRCFSGFDLFLEMSALVSCTLRN